MTPRHETTARADERELTITRLFAAPRELVFEAWTKAEHLSKWSCPRDLEISFAQSDVRPGGSLRVCMRSPDGNEYWLSGEYREVVAPSRLVFTHAWDDAAFQTIVTVTLEPEGDKTRLTLHQAPFPDRAQRDGHESGWSSTLDNLAEHLEAMR